MIHRKQLITVENLKNETGTLHPVQQAMVETNGSQCGYCTPGFIMSLFSLYKSSDHPSRSEIEDALTGNLCRCTGYRPIIEAAARSCAQDGTDHFSSEEKRTAVLLKSIPDSSLKIQTPSQKYFRPVDLREALLLKERFPSAVVVSGATDVALRVTKKHEVLQEVIDVSGVDELKKIRREDGSVTIGAGLPLSDVMRESKEDFPALHDMLTVFGSQQIRNLATLGGNLGTASPIGDMLPVLMAYKATVILQNRRRKREISLNAFVTGYRNTVREPNELIVSVIVPKLQNGTQVRSYKVSKRKDLDISTASGGFRLELKKGNSVNSVILAYGGMAERTMRAASTEQFLVGKPWSRESVEEAMGFIEKDFSPISDVRGGAEFRRIVARNLLFKFWNETRGG